MLLALTPHAGLDDDDGQTMKICVLLMLISAIVGLSHRPIRSRTAPTTPVAPDSLPA
jgi:hypothetical protein